MLPHVRRARWAIYQAVKSPLDVQFAVDENYLLQIAGPTSLQTLEHATGEDLRDIGFLDYRPTTVDGISSEICRIGMSGTLAYELRGPIADGAKFYDAVVRAGADFGLERLGWRTYMVNHLEGRLPALTWTFMFSAYEDPGYKGFARDDDVLIVTGSVDPADMRARYRPPVELDWHRAAPSTTTHCRARGQMADPKRTIVTLRWNPKDALPSTPPCSATPPYKTLELPLHTFHRCTHAYADYFREVISHGCVGLDLAREGTEVIVQWGDHGGPIKDVRATVARYPYLDLESN